MQEGECFIRKELNNKKYAETIGEPDKKDPDDALSLILSCIDEAYRNVCYTTRKIEPSYECLENCVNDLKRLLKFVKFQYIEICHAALDRAIFTDQIKPTMYEIEKKLRNIHEIEIRDFPEVSNILHHELISKTKLQHKLFSQLEILEVVKDKTDKAIDHWHQNISKAKRK